MAKQTVSGPTGISIGSGATSAQAQYFASKTPATWSVQVEFDGSLSPNDYIVSISSTGLLTVTLMPGVIVPAPGTSLSLTVSASSGPGNGNNDSVGVSVAIYSTVVPCFLAGTRIATDIGETPVDRLAAGDRVLTTDGGTAVIRWVGSRNVSQQEMARSPKLRPVLFRKDSLGKGLPNRDLFLSPLHRVKSSCWQAQLLFGALDVLIHAFHLPQAESSNIQDVSIQYFHILCDRHEVIFANGAPAETLFPGDVALLAFEPATVEEINLCLEVSRVEMGIRNRKTALPCLNYREVRLLHSLGIPQYNGLSSPFPFCAS